MKKLVFLFVAVFFTAISSNLFAQGIQQTTTINSTRNYWVNSSNNGATEDAGHGTYVWSVYTWNGTDDYTTSSWTATSAGAGDFTLTGGTTFKPSIQWLAAGHFVVEVVETSNNSCTTVRRFGIHILDLDLLVVTKNHLGTEITTAKEYCNTDEGSIWGDTHDDDLNNELSATMTMTYEISLYTVKGSTTATDLIGSALNTAGWRFTITDASTIPGAPGNVTWTVSGTGVTGSYGGVIEVAPGNSTVTITAEIDNIAANDNVTAEDYILGFSVTPATVNVENGGSSSTDYAEGTEPTGYDGIVDVNSHVNAAVGITVHPIPNTSKIKFD